MDLLKATVTVSWFAVASAVAFTATGIVALSKSLVSG